MAKGKQLKDDDPERDEREHRQAATYRQASMVVAFLSAACTVAGVIVRSARGPVGAALWLVLIALIAIWAWLRHARSASTEAPDYEYEWDPPPPARHAGGPPFPSAWIAAIATFAIVISMFALFPGLLGQSSTGQSGTPLAPQQLGMAGPSSSPATPTQSTIPTSAPTSPTPVPTPTPTPSLPYRADWSQGLAGWSTTSDWQLVGAMLTNNGRGSGDAVTAVAPVDMSSTPDYVVEADIELVRYGDQGSISAADSFGLAVRAPDPKSGYRVGHCAQAGLFVCDPGGPMFSAAIWDAGKQAVLTSAQFTPPAQTWHHYRVEVKGTKITFTVPDLGVNLTTTDNDHVAGGQVGIWSNGCQISVRSFTVAAA